MKIALEEQVWERLYGPYGNRRVNRIIAGLYRQWDSAVANDLFWEELHHQDTIYPATFAALPWLSDVAPAEGEGFVDTYLFLSQVIHCALAKPGGNGPDGNHGLSTTIADHHHSWLPPREWLRQDDRAVLLGLEAWFSANCAALADRCLDLVSSDAVASAYALRGFAALHGCERVAGTVEMFAQGEKTDTIHQYLGPYDARDSHVVALLHPKLIARNPRIVSFMLDYPGCTFVPKGARQADLL
ncbi:hypothetical protein [Halodurantibacterium flavum]|uniref:Uncharacterized protein n=1 Tax=Halodurantibacterium flavum TaxID=1382802 RepID=A0ABW4RZQ8_9RHOB